jgi:hypothetical protein
LQKVNGTVFKEGVGEGVKMHFFPLGENYLENQIHEYEEDGASTYIGDLLLGLGIWQRTYMNWDIAKRVIKLHFSAGKQHPT